MATNTRPEIIWDEDRQQWIVRFGGPGNPVVRSASKEVIEEFLDYVENRAERVRCVGGRGA